MHKICEWHKCSKSFEMKRKDAQFCSDVCRAKANKAKHQTQAPPLSPPAIVPMAAQSPHVSVAARPQPQTSAPNPPPLEAPPNPKDSPSRWVFDYDLDQGDYSPEHPNRKPVTVTGRVAKLEETVFDLRCDLELLSDKNKVTHKTDTSPRPAGLSVEQVRSIVRTELEAAVRPLQEQVHDQEQTIRSLREELWRVARPGAAAKGSNLETRLVKMEDRSGDLLARVTRVEHVLANYMNSAEDEGAEEDAEE